MEEAEKELEWFRSKDPSLMSYGSYSEIFVLSEHVRQMEKAMGLSEEHSKEVLALFDGLLELAMSFIVSGRIREYKNYDMIGEVLKGQFFEIETPKDLFSFRIKHTKEGTKIIGKSDGIET